MPAQAASVPVSIAELEAQLQQFATEQIGPRASYARALSEAVLRELKVTQVERISRHQVSLLTNTINIFITGPAPSDEERAFRAAFIGWATRNLIQSPVTMEDTAQVKAQVASLFEQLQADVEQLAPGQAGAFERDYLPQVMAGADQAAGSLVAGGALHPLSQTDLDAVVAEFGKVATQPGPFDDRPAEKLSAAAGAAFSKFCTVAVHGDHNPTADVKLAQERWIAADRTRRAEERKRDLDEFNALVIRGDLGPDALRLEASSAVCDALALLYELRMFQQRQGGDAAEIVGLASQVCIEFSDGGPYVCRCSGRLNWERDDGLEFVIVSETPEGWFTHYWDGTVVTVKQSVAEVTLGPTHARMHTQIDGIPGSPTVMTRPDSLSFARAMGMQVSASQVFWSSFLPLLQGSSTPETDSRISLTKFHASGLSPLMWNSRPRAVVAERDAGALVLRGPDGQTIARMSGRDGAAIDQPHRFPLTIDMEFARRQIPATTRVVEQDSEGQRAEELTAPIELDVRSLSIQLRISDEDVLLLDEYKAYRFDDTPVCTVRFSAYELTR